MSSPADEYLARAREAEASAEGTGDVTLKAHFLQVAPNGGLSEGTAWLQRPGRMRFQYDPPAPFLLVAAHGLLVFRDSQLNQTSNLFLSQTPLGILLADKVTLSGDVTVTGMAHQPGQIDAFHILHHQILRFALIQNVVDGDDVGMIQRRR